MNDGLHIKKRQGAFCRSFQVNSGQEIFFVYFHVTTNCHTQRWQEGIRKAVSAVYLLFRLLFRDLLFPLQASSKIINK